MENRYDYRDLNCEIDNWSFSVFLMVEDFFKISNVASKVSSRYYNSQENNNTAMKVKKWLSYLFYGQ